MQGNGVKFHFEEASPGGNIAIFTYFNEEQVPENKYYLQPTALSSENYDIIAKTGEAQYVFAFFPPESSWTVTMQLAMVGLLTKGILFETVWV